MVCANVKLAPENITDGIKRIQRAALGNWPRVDDAPLRSFAVRNGPNKGLLVALEITDTSRGPAWCASVSYHPHLLVTQECTKACQREFRCWPNAKVRSSIALLLRTINDVGEGGTWVFLKGPLLNAIRLVDPTELGAGA